MKTIEKDEIFNNLSEFLKAKGVELKDGSYADTVRKSCRIVADVINLGQNGIEKAKTGIDKTLDQVRQTIHEKTAPKPPKMAKPAAQEPESKVTPSEVTSREKTENAPVNGTEQKKTTRAKPTRKSAAQKSRGTGGKTRKAK